jgi:hypothetical protein
LRKREAWCDAVIHRPLAKEPGERFADARAMLKGQPG